MKPELGRKIVIGNTLLKRQWFSNSQLHTAKKYLTWQSMTNRSKWKFRFRNVRGSNCNCPSPLETTTCYCKRQQKWKLISRKSRQVKYLFIEICSVRSKEQFFVSLGILQNVYKREEKMKSAFQGVIQSKKNRLPSSKSCKLCLIHCFSEGFVVLSVL